MQHVMLQPMQLGLVYIVKHYQSKIPFLKIHRYMASTVLDFPKMYTLSKNILILSNTSKLLNLHWYKGIEDVPWYLSLIPLQVWMDCALLSYNLVAA